MIRLENIRKAYDPTTSGAVLKGLSVTIEAGEFVAILGRSGSGKTTLLNIIGGLDRHYEGEATVEGKSLRTLSDKEMSAFRNHTISFVFQSFNLMPHLTCRENVAFPDFFRKGSRAGDARALAETAMERVGIIHKADSYPNRLSGGERQRVAIARAIFQKPAILLADEPTGNLDTKSSQHIMDLFLELKHEDNMSVILVTHDEELAARADRIIRIVDGLVAGDGGLK